MDTFSVCVLFSCSSTIALTWGVAVKQSRKFPDDFIFGTATASYQVEGAWDKDGNLNITHLIETLFPLHMV